MAVPADAAVPTKGKVDAAVPEDAGATPESRSTGAAADLGRVALAVIVLLCGVTMVLGFVNKDRCTGPTFDQWGRSVSQGDFDGRNKRDVCYSDIQFLWLGRDIDRKVFPYIHGSMNEKGELAGGVVEYPVLTGMLIWVSAWLPSNDAQFLLASAIVLAPFGLLTAWLLGRLSRWRALIWALAPPLVLYAFHNWELPVVACAVAAVYVMHRGWGRRGADRPLQDRATAAALLLGLGFAFKLYPAIFVLPLMLYVLTGGRGGTERPAGKRWDVRGALRVAGVAAGTAVAVNLPFMLAGFEGWKASFEFQWQRKADITTNSIWFWGLRPYSNPDNTGAQELISALSLAAISASFVLACVLGWLRYRREGTYPWVPVSAAMLCGFLLLHKVHSPQYTLWLVPMFVLLRIRWTWIVAYLIADLAMGIGIFRWYYEVWVEGGKSGIYDNFAAQAVVIGVWGRAALLVGLFVAFLAARPTTDDFEPDLSDGRPPEPVHVRQ
jgi:uncharacterized membrane protein